MIFFAPKDFKKGRLIANKYRKVDIAIFTIVCLFMLPVAIFSLSMKPVNYILLILSMLSMGIAFFLITPFDLYHNFFTFLELLYIYLKRKKEYKWGGIVKYEEKEE